MKTISVASGGFDPVHSGHIEYLKNAKSLGDKLVVALNSDQWLINKKGNFFLSFLERKNILESFSFVDSVIDFKDDEKGSCCLGLEKIKTLFPDQKIIFCNGGDRNDKNIPELQVQGVEFIFNVGGSNKMNSSSEILKSWSYPKQSRVWGDFYDLYTDPGIKVKELIVKPGKGMSFQKHFHRSEIWLVSTGRCMVKLSDNGDNIEEMELSKHQSLTVEKGKWHQIYNPFNEVCKIIEIQYGDKTIEDDIERLFYFKA